MVNSMNMENILDYVRNLYHKKLDCGKNLLELTTYDNVSMWWVADTLFYDSVKKAINDEIFLFRSNQNKLLMRIFNHRKLFMKFYKSFGIYIIVIYDILIAILVRFLNRIWGRNKQYENNPKTKVLFIAQDRQWGKIRDYETNYLKKSDVFFDSLITKLRKDRYDPIGIYPIDLYPIRGLRIFIDKLKNWHIPHKPLNLYWSFSAWKKEKDAFEHFKKSWDYLIKDKVFREMCIYDGNDLYKEIRDELELYFFILFPHLVKYIQIARTMIKSEKPSLIILLAAPFWWERSLVIASKFENIPTLSIQHGVIHSGDHKSYMYKKNEIATDGSAESPYCPIPDKTAVYGPYYKDLLTKISAYPKNSVIVTGQPRYDILYHMDKIYSREQFLRKYNISTNHKIVLWTTQCQGLSEAENIKNFKCIFRTMQKLKYTVLIIKQHPVDSERYTKLIMEYLKKYKVNAIITPKNSDTYEQIYACDLMITKYSTTGMEAIALNKPVIMLNLSGEADPARYVKEGVALGVYKDEDLEPTIKKLLEDDSMLAKNRAKYIRKYLHKIDGNATERVMKVVNEIVREGKS